MALAELRGADRIASDIVRRIQTGEWPDGYRLPPERELAATYGLARNTVRRALDALDHRLVRIVGRGTYVRNGQREAAHPSAERLKLASPADVMEMRLIIEPQAAALAATRASAEELAGIQDMLRRSVTARGTAGFEEWDAALHLAIFRATKNALLIEYCEAINAARHQPHWYRLKQRSVTEGVRRQYDSEHTAIVAALLQRDAEAARRLVHRHLQHVSENLLAIGA